MNLMMGRFSPKYANRMQNIAPTIGKGIDAKIPPNFPVGKKTKGSNKD